MRWEDSVREWMLIFNRAASPRPFIILLPSVFSLQHLLPPSLHPNLPSPTYIPFQHKYSARASPSGFKSDFPHGIVAAR